jgi:hypothetical protein
MITICEFDRGPTTTTFTAVTTFVSQAGCACAVSAKVFAAEAPTTFASDDYVSAFAKATPMPD